MKPIILILSLIIMSSCCVPRLDELTKEVEAIRMRQTSILITWPLPAEKEGD